MLLGMATADATRASSRRAREWEIVEATRALFDDRGLQDAPIEEIARAVGINRALIYRHFSSKEELFILTVTLYLAEVTERMVAIDPELAPVERLRAAYERFADYCIEHPAFLDCAVSLMRRPARDLRERVSESVWFRLGQAMAASLGPLAQILREGAARGAFAVEDPDFTANQLYTQALGTMHLARMGVGVRQVAPGIPEVFKVSAEEVKRACLEAVVATATAGRAR
jgi:AcrR family transcriptional regulator